MRHLDSAYGNEQAISPVVGVMLMLVVVIIIAAVVSAYGGSLIGGMSKKAPTLTMDVKVVQTGTWHGSGFYAIVTSVSEPIPTKNLKIVTSWNGKVQDVTDYSTTQVSGGSSVVPGIKNIDTLFNPANTATELPSGLYVAPFGSGPGVNGTESLGGVGTLSYTAPTQQFGNYTLLQGTVMSAQPCGGNSSHDIGSSGVSASSGYGIYSPRDYYGKSYGCFADNTEYNSETGDTNLPGDSIPCDGSEGQVMYCTWETGVFGIKTKYCDSSENECDYSWADHVNDPDAIPCVLYGCDGYTGYGCTIDISPSYGAAYSYSSCDYFGQDCSDPTRAVLGTNWGYLKWGDTVNVKVIYIPTGTVIFNKNVEVTEG